ncbi:MAG: pyridoxamine 5'-phosphate oxidase family protein [Cyclobacteriaceae bacterium]
MHKEAIDNATALIKSKQDGVLSTLSVKLDGFPFGSVVPYCLDNAGWPVILISTIAEHTKNIKVDPRCSLTIVMDGEDVQANGRICLIGHMEELPSEEREVMERYYTQFPNSRSYDATHDFSFYRLAPVSIRYIGGFGQIHWFKPDELK